MAAQQTAHVPSLSHAAVPHRALIVRRRRGTARASSTRGFPTRDEDDRVPGRLLVHARSGPQVLDPTNSEDPRWTVFEIPSNPRPS